MAENFGYVMTAKKLEEAMRKNDAGTLMNKVSGLREEVEMMREKNAEQKMRIAELEKCVNELRQILKDRDSAKAFTVPGTSRIIDFDCAKRGEGSGRMLKRDNNFFKDV